MIQCEGQEEFIFYPLLANAVLQKILLDDVD